MIVIWELEGAVPMIEESGSVEKLEVKELSIAEDSPELEELPESEASVEDAEATSETVD